MTHWIKNDSTDNDSIPNHLEWREFTLTDKGTYVFTWNAEVEADLAARRRIREWLKR